MEAARTTAAIALSVWKALFLREAVHRLFGSRAAWAWLLLEPVVHIVLMLLIMTAIRMRVVGGIDTGIWLMVGMSAFFMFKRVGGQTMNAVGSNQALFAYRQVKPVDTVLVRAGLEGFLMLLVILLLFTGAGFVGMEIVPTDPLAVLEALLGLWLVGLGFGLVTSVAVELIPEVGKILAMSMMPLYLISGVVLPIAQIPLPYREWLMYNPLSHGLEAARHSFAPYYQVAPETSITYLYIFALAAIFLGLTLHIRFALRLATK